MASVIYKEAELFGICLLLGMVLALIYDGLRVFRLLFLHQNWLVDLEDLLFWIFTAGFAFSTLFKYNQGTLRGYAFLGMFLGVIFYICTISRWIIFFMECLLPYWNHGKKIIKKPFEIIVGFAIKILKNLVVQVKMAIRGR